QRLCQNNEIRAKRVEAGYRVTQHRSGGDAAPFNSELHAGLRFHKVGKARRHRYGRYDLECKSTRALAASGAGAATERTGHRLEAVPDQPAKRAIRRAKVPRLPTVLALLVRNS